MIIKAPLSTSIVPLIRVRPSSSRNPAESEEVVPTSIRFLSRQESAALPSGLTAEKSSRVVNDSPSPLLTGQVVTATPSPAYQDMLVFQPIDGTLELFRIYLETQETPGTPSRKTRSDETSSQGTTGKKDISTAMRTSALSKMIDRTQPSKVTLKAKDISIATWTIRRGDDWSEVRLNITLPQKTQNRSRQGPAKSVIYTAPDRIC